jgi:S1-C subfamily serine protease
MQHALTVQDLHAITPDEYIQFGDAVVHKLSYQQARSFNREISGVYVANPGYVLGNAAIPRGSVIVELDGREIQTLDDFEEGITGLADLQRAAVRFFTFEDPQASKLRLMRMDRRWFPAMRCNRNDGAASWPCRALTDPPDRPEVEPATAGFADHPSSDVRRILPSLVVVNFDMPYTLSGVSERHYYGTGVIVDAARGYVVVDRNTVPEAMGDVHITFAGSVEVPATVEFVHPLHNLALVRYDPALIGDTPAKSARLSFDMPDPGDDVLVVGLRGDHKVIHQATEVASVEPVFFPLSRTMRFRETNLETLDLVNGPTDIDGVILDKRGRVVSMWSSFAYQGGGELNQDNKGLPAELLQETVALVRDDKPLRSLEVELRQMPMSGAREFGLPQDWADRLEAHDPTRRQVLAVTRTVAGTPAAEALMPGDLLLSVAGQAVTRFREVETAMETEIARLEIFRGGELLSVDVPTVVLHGRGVRRAVMWGGALLQSPYRDMAAQRGIAPYGVYVAYFGYGSPASRYGMFAGRRIVAADGVDTPDLDSFLDTVAGKGDGDSVRLTTVTWNNVVEVLTLEMDETYWPSYEIRHEGGGWARFAIP